jgi:hypothetical protein
VGAGNAIQGLMGILLITLITIVGAIIGDFICW